MITENPRVKKEVEQALDNKIVSYAFLRWLNEQERQARAAVLGTILSLTFGQGFGGKLVYSVISFVLRKEIADFLDKTKEITKESFIKLIEKIQKYKNSHK